MKVTIENWEDMSEDQRTEMVDAIWAQEDDRLPENWTDKEAMEDGTIVLYPNTMKWEVV
jgi:hypothetical protein|tara:strand:- start:1520 stop:1696 length:177 start_codon:yes stop_codon:yes gene_type:complete